MRYQSVILLLSSLFAVGCGLPDVEVPGGNQALTSDKPESEASVALPVVKDAPSTYPNRTLVIRGIAVDAARVFVKGAGNPVVANVSAGNGDTFCVAVDLATPGAEYALEIQSQNTSGDLSDTVELKVKRQADAPPPPAGTTLCDGTPLN